MPKTPTKAKAAARPTHARASSKADRTYDAIVVGGGHNGLTAAAYLAKAGQRVCVLERRDILGGACVTEEVWPGHRVSRASYVVSLLSPKVVSDLRLKDFGYEPHPLDPAYAAMDPDGRAIFFHNDLAPTVASIARRACSRSHASRTRPMRSRSRAARATRSSKPSGRTIRVTVERPDVEGAIRRRWRSPRNRRTAPSARPPREASSIRSRARRSRWRRTHASRSRRKASIRASGCAQ